MAQSKYWCYTLNNYTDDDVVCCRGIDEQDACTYHVFGYELSGTGTPHLQGYIEFSKRLRLQQVQRLLGGRCHLSIRFKTAEQAAAYCKKDGNFVEFGTISQPQQGKRTDLDTIRESISDGATELEVASEHFSRWVVYRNSFERYRELISQDGIRSSLYVFVLWGAAGTGKSRYAYEKFPDLYSVPSPNLQWFDGYAGESTILVDDYRGGCDEGFLLKFLDIYPLRLPVKGGFRKMRAVTVVITSNIKPPFGHSAPETLGAISRRIKTVVCVEDGMTFADIDAIVYPE